MRPTSDPPRWGCEVATEEDLKDVLLELFMVFCAMFMAKFFFLLEI
jgi:hypothetical protein